MRVNALMWQVGDALQLGDVAALRAGTAALVRMVRDLRQPADLWIVRAIEGQSRAVRRPLRRRGASRRSDGGRADAARERGADRVGAAVSRPPRAGTAGRARGRPEEPRLPVPDRHGLARQSRRALRRGRPRPRRARRARRRLSARPLRGPARPHLAVHPGLHRDGLRALGQRSRGGDGARGARAVLGPPHRRRSVLLHRAGGPPPGAARDPRRPASRGARAARARAAAVHRIRRSTAARARAGGAGARPRRAGRARVRAAVPRRGERAGAAPRHGAARGRDRGAAPGAPQRRRRAARVRYRRARVAPQRRGLLDRLLRWRNGARAGRQGPALPADALARAGPRVPRPRSRGRLPSSASAELRTSRSSTSAPSARTARRSIRCARTPSPPSGTATSSALALRASRSRRSATSSQRRSASGRAIGRCTPSPSERARA